MRLLIYILLSASFIVILAAGCVGNSITTSPDADLENPVSASISDQDGRMIWGIWEITIDPVTLEAQAVPFRAAGFHANVRKFLEEGPCTTCLALVPPIVPKPYGMDVDIRITHPFPGQTYFNGFDVRGIIILDGEYQFPNMGLRSTHAASGGPALLNPDGYARIFNAVEYTMPGIFGYSQGKLVNADWGLPMNTLNAFRAYYSDGQGDEAGGRRGFLAGDSVTRTYEIQVGQTLPFKFWYAIDASWAKPTGSEPYDYSDFPPEANCSEAYRFDISVMSGELYTEGGSVTIGVDIYDHQGHVAPWSVMYEAPECMMASAIIYADPGWIDGDVAHWDFNVTNMLGGLSPGDGAELIVGYGNNTPDPFLGNVRGYDRFTIPVSEGPEAPVVISIDPDWGVQDGAVDNAEIFGENFIDGCTVMLQKTGQPAIDGMDVVFIDDQNIACDFNLLGAELGLWDVVVTNPGDVSGMLEDGFEVLEPSGCNGALHSNYLGTGDFSGGTHMGAPDAVFVHDTGTDSDGEFLGYISGFAGTVVATYIIDTLTPEDGHPLGTGWGNPQPGSWPVPISIDVSEEYGQFFIVWSTNESLVEVWEAEDGKLAGSTDAAGGGRVFSIDTDGSGGFWCGYYPEIGFAPGIKHFVPDGPQPGTLVEETSDTFLLPEAWGTPHELAVIPGERLLVLSGSQQGRIRMYDISSSPPVYVGDINNLFSDSLKFDAYPIKPCDMDIDWSNPDVAHCRIVVMGRLDSGGTELLKIDTDLTIWAGPISIPSKQYHTMAINPDTGDIAMWPAESAPGEYALIEQPAGW